MPTHAGEWMRISLQQGASGVWHLPSLHDSGEVMLREMACVFQYVLCIPDSSDFNWFQLSFACLCISNVSFAAQSMGRKLAVKFMLLPKTPLTAMPPWTISSEHFGAKRIRRDPKSVGQSDLHAFFNIHTQLHIIRYTLELLHGTMHANTICFTEAWSPDKKHWCCTKRGKGCEGSSPPAVDAGFGMVWKRVQALDLSSNRWLLQCIAI